MAFIEVTDQSTEQKFAINIDHVVSVHPNDNRAVIQVTAVRSEKAVKHFVLESYNEVLSLIQKA